MGILTRANWVTAKDRAGLVNLYESRPALCSHHERRPTNLRRYRHFMGDGPPGAARVDVVRTFRGLVPLVFW